MHAAVSGVPPFAVHDIMSSALAPHPLWLDDPPRLNDPPWLVDTPGLEELPWELAGAPWSWSTTVPVTEPSLR